MSACFLYDQLELNPTETVGQAIARLNNRIDWLKGEEQTKKTLGLIGQAEMQIHALGHVPLNNVIEFVEIA